jgi:hypothetical protein
MNDDSINNDDSMDGLVALYREVAQEAPRAGVDARILEIAEAAGHRHRHRQRVRWPWLAAALAAGMLIWLTSHRSAPAAAPQAQAAASNATPGYLDGRTRAYLLQMDVAPPLSPSARYLLTQDTSPD